MLTNVTETSIDAFNAHVGSGKASAQQARILSFIAVRGGDWRIGELVECPKRKDRESGVTVRPVSLPTGHEVGF